MTLRLLGSFHYLQRCDISAWFAEVPGGVDFFADSGGFSAMTTGATIDIAAYARWLLTHRAVVNMAAGLDVVGDWHATAVNLDRLHALVGDAVQIVPAYHVRSPWSELRRLCRTYPVVALGGAVRLAGAEYEAAMLRWCANAHVIARDHDVRLHGFGLTRPPYPMNLPWYSTDSSYWTAVARTGAVKLWDTRAHRFVKVQVGRRSAAKHARLIAFYGADPRLAASPGFAVRSKVGARGTGERTWLVEATLASEWRFEEYLRSVKPPVPEPRGGRVVGRGYKLYTTFTDRGEMQSIVGVAAREGRLPQTVRGRS